MSGPGIKLETGHVLDERYLLENVIGEGGMGTVFAARHLELGDIVAVKVLQSEAAVSNMHEENLERFVREARIAAKIKNDHVVRILDVARGKNGSPPYIVMELLDGIDLADLVKSLGRIQVSQAVDYILQACEALAEAHSLGIVHRDLKSSNLHVSQRGDGTPLLKVLDFGISKAHDEAGDINLTATSAVFGSPAYMSPEQIRSAKHVDPRTDVWALNVVLYELITGELPFVGDSASAMLASISADPYVPVRKHLPAAPIELERAVYAAFVKDREQRTGSISAYAESIAPFGGPTAAAALHAVHRAAHRISTRSAMGSGPVNVVSSQTPSSPRSTGHHVSDTMRASSPIGSGPFDVTTPSGIVSSPVTRTGSEAKTEPLPQLPPTARSAQRDAIMRTDREMVVPATRPGGTSFVAIAAAVLAVVIGLGLVGLVFHLKTRPRKQAEFPPPPVVVTVTVTAPTAPLPSASVTAEPGLSIDLPANPNTPRKPPRGTLPQHSPPHAPSAAPPPKPTHGTPDTNQRE